MVLNSQSDLISWSISNNLVLTTFLFEANWSCTWRCIKIRLEVSQTVPKRVDVSIESFVIQRHQKVGRRNYFWRLLAALQRNSLQQQTLYSEKVLCMRKGSLHDWFDDNDEPINQRLKCKDDLHERLPPEVTRKCHRKQTARNLNNPLKLITLSYSEDCVKLRTKCGTIFHWILKLLLIARRLLYKINVQHGKEGI